MFKYLGRLLDRSNEDWPTFLCNIRKARQVWGKFKKLLRREEAEPSVSERFYCAFGANGAEVRGIACGFPEAGHKTKSKAAEGRVVEEATTKIFLRGAGTQPLRTYVDMRHMTVADWVALQPIFDVCARDMGYEEGGRLWVPWWRKAAAKKQLKVKIEAISEVARVRRRQKSGRRGRSEGELERGGMDSKG